VSFGGELKTFDVFDLLEWISHRAKTGLLQLSRRSTTKKLAFGKGVLVSSSSNDPRETMGQVLVRDGLVAEAALFGALLKQEQDRRRLGDILIGDGLLTQEQLLRTLRSTIEMQLYDVFLWPDGRFEFDDAASVPGALQDLAIDLRPVLEEGRHRRVLWNQLQPRFPSTEMTFRLTSDPVSVTDPGLRAILNLAAWGKTLAAISLETRRGEYETMLLIAGLCDEGLLAPDRIEAGRPDGDPVGTMLTYLAGAEERLREGRFESAAEFYERVLAIDPINHSAKKGLLAVAEAQQRARTAMKVPQDKVPALRLTALSLSQMRFGPEEGFVLSRINGQWDVRSILKLCPFPEDQTLVIFSRLLDRSIIDLH
jgi:hypothetical protein